jgi:hypothetical protein
VAVASYFFEEKAYSKPYYATLALLTLGITLGVSASPDFHMLGFLICLSSVLGCTAQIVITGYFMGGQSVTLHVFDILFYSALPSVVLLTPVFVALGEPHVVANAIATLGLAKFLGLVAAGGAMACGYNILIIVFIKYTSSVYVAIAGGFKVCLIIGISFVIFDQKMTTLSLVGIIIACIAFMANSYIQFQNKQTAKQKGYTQIDEDVDPEKVADDILSAKQLLLGAEENDAEEEKI